MSGVDPLLRVILAVAAVLLAVTVYRGLSPSARLAVGEIGAPVALFAVWVGWTGLRDLWRGGR
jgi:hypothetical protein